MEILNPTTAESVTPSLRADRTDVLMEGTGATDGIVGDEMAEMNAMGRGHVAHAAAAVLVT